MIPIFSVLENDEQRKALASFYEANKDRLYAIAYSRLGNRAEAEDAVMEVFSSFARKPESFFGVQSGKRQAYAAVVAKNIACKMLKMKQNKPVELVEDIDAAVLKAQAADISTEEIFLGDEAARELIGFIRAMPEGKKDALLLWSLYGRSTTEIAVILDISEAATRKRLSDAKKLIKGFLRGREG